MQRYHDTRNDPLPIHSPLHETERTYVSRLVSEYLARGGEIEQIGHRMSNTPAAFTINPERSPVYAHLFAPIAAEAVPPAQVRPEPTTESDQTDERRLAALIMADATVGNSSKWIAKKHHMTEKRVRQIARDYHITFHVQR
ncbi:hypothetical protein [Pseudomonas fluorescens]|uniref:hypothetical protein n=1 Tax=Pseudomonas fluorescens TaxID=294 RepID=UPI0007D0442E|nr:hypothetical protein [Pseudomonas fluorescens]